MALQTRMPRDQNDNPIPALRPGSAHKASTISATAVSVGPFTAGVQVVSIYCRDAPLRFMTGGQAVTADEDSHFIDAGERLWLSLGNIETADLDTHLSIIRAGETDGTIEISEFV